MDGFLLQKESNHRYSGLCGIVGAVSKREVAPILIEGLKRLEYRGYDSAGLSTVENGSGLTQIREVGKLSLIHI